MKYLTKKKIFFIVFVIVVFGFAAYNIYQNRDALLKTVEKEASKGSYFDIDIDNIDSALTENMEYRLEFIESFGMMQKLMGKDEFNNFEFVKDHNGFLNYGAFYREDDPDIFEYAQRVKRLQNYVEPYGTKVLFVITPSKYDRNNSDYSDDMPVNDPYNKINELKFYLRRLGVETLDLGDSLPGDRITYEDAFFKTDHHWTPMAAFEAADILTDELNERFEANLDPFDYYGNIDNYEVKEYSNIMLGSMGRNTGVNYSGMDDFTAVIPTFDGNFTRRYYEEDGSRTKLEGTIHETLLNYDLLKKDLNIYEEDPYAFYLDELKTFEKIDNNELTDGDSVLFLRDSYFSPVMTFMAPLFKEMDAMYLLEESDEFDIEDFIKGEYEEDDDYDYIIIEMYPGNIDDDAFNFFED